jgi:hypothetical protein
MKFILTFFLTIFAFSSFSQEDKKVQFVGGARSIISNADFSSDQEDTVTSRKNSGGYALIDLGFKINPNASTEILGMVRIKNAFGGFWGSGVTFDVRQIHVKGVVKNALRYQIGNIDYKLTPYTFYNHNADLLVQSSSVLRIKEEVLNYESFYKNNTWRQQGAAIDFALQFPKVLDEIKVNAFITRLNPSNLGNILERLYGGGNVIFTQSKYLTLGFNHVSIFDLKNTALNDNAYRNNVSSVSYKATLDLKKHMFGISGESGFSSSALSLDTTGGLNDYFINVQANFQHKKSGLKAHLGYMDNGADFRSFGAQSKRVDFNQLNNFYERYTNDQIIRPLSNYDLYNDPTLYSNSITTGIMAYNPAVNNVLPYGIATFNRRGLFAGLTVSNKQKSIKLEANYYRLGEVRGQGTTKLRNFNSVNANLEFNFSTMFNWKKEQKLTAGYAFQDTKRTSELSFEQIALKSTTLNLGLEMELVDDLYLLANSYYFKSKGNESMPVRNSDGEIINYTAMNISGEEVCLAGGLKYNFTPSIYLAAIYESNSNSFSSVSSYRYNQFYIYYIMKF